MCQLEKVWCLHVFDASSPLCPSLIGGFASCGAMHCQDAKGQCHSNKPCTNVGLSCIVDKSLCIL